MSEAGAGDGGLKNIKTIVLVAGNVICAAIAAAIVFYAIRTWPARYANHTLSWSVTGFFVLFVTLSAVGSVAAIIYLRGARSLFLKLAAAPLSLLGLGLLVGLTKAAMTGDL